MTKQKGDWRNQIGQYNNKQNDKINNDIDRVLGKTDQSIYGKRVTKPYQGGVLPTGFVKITEKPKTEDSIYLLFTASLLGQQMTQVTNTIAAPPSLVNNQIPRPRKADDFLKRNIYKQCSNSFSDQEKTQIVDAFSKLSPEVKQDLYVILQQHQNANPTIPFIEKINITGANMAHSCLENKKTGRLILTQNSMDNIANENIDQLNIDLAHELEHHKNCLSKGYQKNLPICEKQYNLYVNILEALAKDTTITTTKLDLANRLIRYSDFLVKNYEKAVLEQEKIALTLNQNTDPQRKVDFLWWIAKIEQSRILSYKQNEWQHCTEMVANTMDRFGKVYGDTYARDILNAMHAWYHFDRGETIPLNPKLMLGNQLYNEVQKNKRGFEKLVKEIPSKKTARHSEL